MQNVHGLESIRTTFVNSRKRPVTGPCILHAFHLSWQISELVNQFTGDADQLVRMAGALPLWFSCLQIYSYALAVTSAATTV